MERKGNTRAPILFPRQCHIYDFSFASFLEVKKSPQELRHPNLMAAKREKKDGAPRFFLLCVTQREIEFKYKDFLENFHKNCSMNNP